MRKYQQLALLIISSFCLVLLLFYRHEYLKLRNVLSVLNFFGNPVISNATCLDFNVDLKESISQRYKYAEPRSVWSKFDNHFLYSSFWEDHDEGGTARTLAVGPKDSFFHYKCRIWFEIGNVITSEQGDLTFDVDVRSKTKTLEETVFKYFLKCNVKTKSAAGIPYGVLWIAPTNSTILSPIFTFKKDEGKAVICVLPDYSGTPKTQIVEFITYYNMLGVDDFIIYDAGIQHSIFPFLESTVGRNGILQSVTTLPWNFPISNNLELEKQSLVDDCLSRTFGSAKMVGIVTWDEYIMPTKNIKLNGLMPVDSLNDLISVSLETWVCCEDRIDDVKSLPKFLRTKHCIRRKQEDKLFVNKKPYENSSKNKHYELPSLMGVMRRYDSCDMLPRNFEKILPVPEFFSQFTTHRLPRLWKSHLNASSIFRS